MNLVTCRSCAHWTINEKTVMDLGTCAANAWEKSFAPGVGYGHAPFADVERRCEQHRPQPAVLPGYVRKPG